MRIVLKIVCRCQDASEDEIIEAIEEGYADIESLKRYTGVGTGPCQGKYCISNLIRMLSNRTGIKGEEIPFPTPRPTTVPIRLGALAKSSMDRDEPQDSDQRA
jgi:bacterioferritin-associated ferredoxin